MKLRSNQCHTSNVVLCQLPHLLSSNVSVICDLHFTTQQATMRPLMVLMLCLLLPLTIATAATAAGSIHGQLRILAVPLLPTSPALDMMAVLAELSSRGHKVLVVAAAAHMDFFKTATARHSSNTSAESLQYLGVDVGISPSASPSVAAAAAAAEKAQAGAGATAESRSKPQQPSRGSRHVKPGQVTQSRFAVPHFPRTLTAALELELVIQDVVAEPCAALLEDRAVFEALRDFQPDVITAIGMQVPDTATDSCGCLLSHALGVPLFDIDCGITFWSGPPIVPQFGSGLTPKDLSTLSGSIQNHLSWLIRKAAMPVLTGLKATPWSEARDRLGLPRASSDCPLVDAFLRLTGHSVKRCDVLLNAIMGSWLLEYPRPLAANQKLLGPGTPRPPQPIREPEVAAFVGGASSGLVLVAFGTSFQFNSWLSLTDYKELSAAFASLAPMRVLWHINTKVLPKGVSVEQLALGNNTLLVPRIDYNDVLGHPSARVFVSHCGLHSVYEAAYHAVPVVGLPFMFEQAESGSKLAAAGAAVMCTQAPAYRTGAHAHVHYTRQHVAGLIRQVLETARYHEAAQRLSVVLQTQAKRRHPYAAAADEVELAVDMRRVQQQALSRKQLQQRDGDDAGREVGETKQRDVTEL